MDKEEAQKKPRGKQANRPKTHFLEGRPRSNQRRQKKIEMRKHKKLKREKEKKKKGEHTNEDKEAPTKKMLKGYELLKELRKTR